LFAVVVEWKLVGCRNTPKRILQRSNLLRTSQAKLDHPECVLTRSARSRSQKHGNGCKPRKHGKNVRGTEAMRNGGFPPIADIGDLGPLSTQSRHFFPPLRPQWQSLDKATLRQQAM
jgi:hypothetical protein